MQLTLLDPLPTARAADPDTSHEAASLATVFQRDHFNRIATALGGESLTAGEIGSRAGMDNVQVSRRLPEMEKMGRVVRDGARVCAVKGTKMTAWRLA
jgi:predicted Rossmann fold nucleotide-binding protein DprA/Smf involved in DNA uptake